MTQVAGWAHDLAGVLRGANDPGAPLHEQAVVVSSATTTFLSIQRVNTFRFNSLAVAYSVPERWARRLGARSLSVALQGNNLGLRTNYRGFDPNVNSALAGTTLRDDGVLPLPRTWQVRVSATY
jgi:hypothetical protein